MRIEEIIEKLCNHEITKNTAISELKNIANKKQDEDLKFKVEGIAFTSDTDSGILNLRLPYQYSSMKGKFRLNDRVYVTLVH